MLLIIDYSPAFSTTVPYVLEFEPLNLVERPHERDFCIQPSRQTRRTSLHLGPLLYSFNTSDCTAFHLSNTIKFAVGMIAGHESAYRKEIYNLARWSTVTLNPNPNYFRLWEVQD